MGRHRAERLGAKRRCWRRPEPTKAFINPLFRKKFPCTRSDRTLQSSRASLGKAAKPRRGNLFRTRIVSPTRGWNETANGNASPRTRWCCRRSSAAAFFCSRFAMRSARADFAASLSRPQGGCYRSRLQIASRPLLRQLLAACRARCLIQPWTRFGTKTPSSTSCMSKRFTIATATASATFAA